MWVSPGSLYDLRLGKALLIQNGKLVHCRLPMRRSTARTFRVFGGMGFCKDLPIQRYYHDARIARIYDGTSEIHRTVIARGLVKWGASLFGLRR
jgi:acyl-CoA dehydrogenase